MNLLVLGILVHSVALYCRIGRVLKSSFRRASYAWVKAACQLCGKLKVIGVGEALMLVVVIAGTVEWATTFSSNCCGVGIALHDLRVTIVYGASCN
jgi:hypothetical protein